MEQKKEINYYSKAVTWIHAASAVLILQNVVGALMILFLYTSANLTYDNPIAIAFLSVYAPLCLGQLYSAKKIREGVLQGGKIALYADSILILVCSIDIVIAGWGISEQSIELVVILLVLNMLVVFLLSATPAKELRISIDDGSS